MATRDDVRRMALALPETDEHLSRGNAHWRVREKGFVWERPLRQSDLPISVEELEELIVEAWLCRAPKRVAQAYLDSVS